MNNCTNNRGLHLSGISRIKSDNFALSWRGTSTDWWKGNVCYDEIEFIKFSQDNKTYSDLNSFHSVYSIPFMIAIISLETLLHDSPIIHYQKKLVHIEIEIPEDVKKNCRLTRMQSEKSSPAFGPVSCDFDEFVALNRCNDDHAPDPIRILFQNRSYQSLAVPYCCRCLRIIICIYLLIIHVCNTCQRICRRIVK